MMFSDIGGRASGGAGQALIANGPGTPVAYDGVIVRAGVNYHFRAAGFSGRTRRAYELASTWPSAGDYVAKAQLRLKLPFVECVPVASNQL
jgi:hypothetical protein